jgi:glycosyltransferase involved in cell wall biosynthesis
MKFKKSDSFLKNYDCVIVTNIPNFYKINLYNELAKNLRICVVFLAKKSEERNDDFSNTSACKFDFTFLTNSSLESRNSLLGSFRIIKLLKSIQFSSLIIAEWYGFEYWISLFFFGLNSKIIFTLESNSLGRGVFGKIKDLAKMFFLKGVDIALPSGPSHREVLNHLGFSKKFFILNGVGIANDFSYNRSIKERNTSYKLLFVGRLIEDKNIKGLLGAFNEVSKFIDVTLTIVGTGPLKSLVVGSKNSRITYYEKFNNEEMHNVYRDHHILILPSLKEPWGLVIEEALSSKMPVIVSQYVGCLNAIIFDKINGIVVDVNNLNSIIEGIKYLVTDSNFEIVFNQVKLFNRSEKDIKQVEVYINAIKYE